MTEPGKRKASKRKIESYDHKGKKRANNPQVGLVTPQTDVESAPKKYAYDPHLDPQLVWAGKAERTSFEIPTVSLHVHERIEPRTILEAVRKKNGAGTAAQGYLFDAPDENLPLRDALDFYKHPHGWSNRLIAGDSLLVMNSLLEKEGLGGQVQMIYIDPPYGIRYGSNFQPFVNKRIVKDGNDEDLTQEPEMIRAFRDTWELGTHSYLTYLRDRLFLAKDLLSESGSVFVQISDENVHRVRQLLDEVFLPDNFFGQIIFRKKMMPLSKKPGCESMSDYLLWYVKAKVKAEVKIRQLFLRQQTEGDDSWNQVELSNSERRVLTAEEIANHKLLPPGSKVYSTISFKPREYRPNQDFNFEFEGQTFPPPGGDVSRTPDGVNCWSTTPEGMARLHEQKRIQRDGKTLRYVLFHEDYPVSRLTASWRDTAPPKDMRYVVETAPLVVQRCVLMATDPGELVFDPTCGSGTTAAVAERWGRRWITCDTSRVAIAVARQRLMTALYDYYELAHPDEGVGSGFRYKTVPHVTLGSVANDEPPAQETLYDQAFLDKSRARVTGPFTVEAVPAPVVKPLSVVEEAPAPADASLGRSGPALRHAEWRAELHRTGVRARGGQMIQFTRVEPLGGTRWLHADAESKPAERGAGGRDDAAAYGKPERVVISFGPEHAPLEQNQVELAWEEARTLDPRPSILLFAAFQFDPEAAKDIDELTKEKTGMTFLKVQMNTDLLTEDLKKKRASNQSFWLMGQPDVDIREREDGMYEVEVRGFDYYNPKTGEIESGDVGRIALWMLDTDYDGRSTYPRQFFFPMAGEGDGWARLAKNLKAEIDPGRIEKYRGTISLPFEAGEHERVAVKIVDDRGIESLRILEIPA